MWPPSHPHPPPPPERLPHHLSCSQGAGQDPRTGCSTAMSRELLVAVASVLLLLAASPGLRVADIHLFQVGKLCLWAARRGLITWALPLWSLAELGCTDLRFGAQPSTAMVVSLVFWGCHSAEVWSRGAGVHAPASCKMLGPWADHPASQNLSYPICGGGAESRPWLKGWHQPPVPSVCKALLSCLLLAMPSHISPHRLPRVRARGRLHLPFPSAASCFLLLLCTMHFDPCK